MPGGRIGRIAESGLRRAALFGLRRPWTALAVAGVVTALSLWSARRLKVDTDLANMLPRSFESVKNVELLKRRFGGIGYVTVHVSGADAKGLERFAREVAPRLEALPTVRYVEFRRPLEFFKDRALYYMDVDDLKTVYTRIAARVKYHKLRENPLYEDLEETPPPSIDMSDLTKKYDKRAGKESGQPGPKSSEYYVDEKGRQLVLLVKPTRLSTQIPFARRVVADVQRVIDHTDLSKYAPGTKVQLCGRYTKRVEQQAAIQADLSRTSVVAIVLMLLYLGLHFRRVTAVALVLAPLGVGLVWTFGLAAVMVDELNLLSAFFGVILLGLGVDHGIHLLARVQQAHTEGRSVEEAVRTAFSKTGRAVLIAAVTTTFGFIGLSLSEFRGFREFGRIAAAGSVLVVVAYVLVMPALIRLVTGLGWRFSTASGKSRSRLSEAVLRLSPFVFGVGMVALLLTALEVPQARFEYDFAKINRRDLPSVRVDRRVDGILGRSQAPLVILTERAEDAAAAAEALRARSKKAGSGIDFVVTTADFVPKEQAAKRKIILKILHALKQVHETDFEGKARDQVRRLKRYEHLGVFTIRDLPQELRRRFQAPDAKEPGQFVLIFASVSLSDGARLRTLAKELRDIPLPGGRKVSAAGAGMIIADVLDMVFRESPRVMVITVCFVFGIIWLLIGGFRRALLCLVPAVITLVATVGLLPLVGVRFNFLNVVMLPVLLGLGVDGGVHLVIRYGQGEPLPEILSETGRAIAGALLTTALGFGALILAHHPGLSSLARLALIGLGCNLVATLLLLPALLALIDRFSGAARKRR